MERFLLLGGSLVACAFTWWLCVGLWRDQGFYERRVRTLESTDSYLSEALTKGMFRASLPLAVIMTGMVITFLSPFGLDSSMGTALDQILTGIIVVCPVLFLSILLFNRPHFLMPRYLRREEGVFQRFVRDLRERYNNRA